MGSVAQDTLKLLFVGSRQGADILSVASKGRLTNLGLLRVDGKDEQTPWLRAVEAFFNKSYFQQYPNPFPNDNLVESALSALSCPLSQFPRHKSLAELFSSGGFLPPTQRKTGGKADSLTNRLEQEIEGEGLTDKDKGFLRSLCDEMRLYDELREKAKENPEAMAEDFRRLLTIWVAKQECQLTWTLSKAGNEIWLEEFWGGRREDGRWPCLSTPLGPRNFAGNYFFYPPECLKEAITCEDGVPTDRNSVEAVIDFLDKKLQSSHPLDASTFRKKTKKLWEDYRNKLKEDGKPLLEKGGKAAFIKDECRSKLEEGTVRELFDGFDKYQFPDVVRLRADLVFNIYMGMLGMPAHALPHHPSRGTISVSKESAGAVATLGGRIPIDHLNDGGSMEVARHHPSGMRFPVDLDQLTERDEIFCIRMAGRFHDLKPIKEMKEIPVVVDHNSTMPEDQGRAREAIVEKMLANVDGPIGKRYGIAAGRAKALFEQIAGDLVGEIPAGNLGDEEALKTVLSKAVDTFGEEESRRFIRIGSEGDSTIGRIHLLFFDQHVELDGVDACFVACQCLSRNGVLIEHHAHMSNKRFHFLSPEKRRNAAHAKMRKYAQMHRIDESEIGLSSNDWVPLFRGDRLYVGEFHVLTVS